MQNFPDIPDYRIIRELGRGGMSRVYLAIQEALQREVAVKVMSRNLDDLERLERRFLNEARTLARLSHRNIVTVIDIRRSEVATFISMEHLPGGTLGDRLAKGISVSEAVSVVAQIASALQFAHDHGVVHRDLKPDNILFRANGTPVLTDFGIAKEQNVNKTSMTQAGMFIGTPSYMSPEQIQSGTVDGRSDQYSLGVVLYEILRGRKPFVAESATAVLLMHLTETPEPLPPELHDFQPIMDRMLAKKPEDRFPNCGEFAKELRRAVTRSETLWALVQSEPDVSVSEQLRALGFSGTHTMPGRVVTAEGMAPAPPGYTPPGSGPPPIAPTGVGTLIPEPINKDATQFGQAPKPATRSIPSVGDLVPPQQIASLLARDPLEPPDISLAAAHLRPHLERGAGTGLKMQLLQRLIEAAEYAPTEEHLEDARHLLDCAAAVLGHMVDFADVVGAIKMREQSLHADAEKQTKAADHLARAQAAIRARLLLPPDDGNAYDHLQAALAIDPDLAAARQLLNRLPTAISAVIDAFGQRDELEAAQDVAERAAAAFPEQEDFAEQRDHFEQELRFRAGKAARERRLDALTAQFREAPMANFGLALSELLELGEAARSDPKAKALAGALEQWCLETAESEDLDQVAEVHGQLATRRAELPLLPDLQNALGQLDARARSLQQAREHDEAEARHLSGLDRALANPALLFQSGRESLVAVLKSAGQSGIESALAPKILAAVPELEKAVREAVRSGRPSVNELETWLRSLESISLARPMVPKLRALIEQERNERELVAKATVITNGLTGVWSADAKLERVLKELIALMSSKADHVLLRGAAEQAFASYQKAAEQCDSPERYAELLKIDRWVSPLAELLGATGKQQLQHARQLLEDSKADFETRAVTARVQTAIDVFERQPTREHLAKLAAAIKALDSVPQAISDRAAALRTRLDQLLQSELDAQRWDQIDQWLEAAGPLLEGGDRRGWRSRRDAALEASNQTAKRIAEQTLEFTKRLTAAQGKPTELARLFSELRKLDQGQDRTLAAACAERFRMALPADIDAADDVGLAVIEAVVMPWSRMPVAGVPAADLADRIEARRASLATRDDQTEVQEQALVAIRRLGDETDPLNAAPLFRDLRHALGKLDAARNRELKEQARVQVLAQVERALAVDDAERALAWLKDLGADLGNAQTQQREADCRARVQARARAIPAAGTPGLEATRPQPAVGHKPVPAPPAPPNLADLPTRKDLPKPTSPQADTVQIGAVNAPIVASSTKPDPSATVALPVVPQVKTPSPADTAVNPAVVAPQIKTASPADTAVNPAVVAPQAKTASPADTAINPAVTAPIKAEPSKSKSEPAEGKHGKGRARPAAKQSPTKSEAKPVPVVQPSPEPELTKPAQEMVNAMGQPLAPKRRSFLIPGIVAGVLAIVVAVGVFLPRDEEGDVTDQPVVDRPDVETPVTPTDPPADPNRNAIRDAWSRALTAKGAADMLKVLEQSPAPIAADTPDTELADLRKKVQARVLIELDRMLSTDPKAVQALMPRVQAQWSGSAEVAELARNLNAALADKADGALKELYTRLTAKRWFEPANASAWAIVQQAAPGERAAMEEALVEALGQELKSAVATDPASAATLVTRIRREQSLSQPLDKPLRDLESAARVQQQVVSLKGELASVASAESLRGLLAKADPILRDPMGARYRNELEQSFLPKLRTEIDRALAAKDTDRAKALLASARTPFPQSTALNQLDAQVSQASIVVVNSVLVVDALPWAEVVSITDQAGKAVSLPADRSTPLRLDVPVGRYTVTMRHPSATTAANVAVEVRQGGSPAQALSRFEVVNVDRILE